VPFSKMSHIAAPIIARRCGERFRKLLDRPVVYPRPTIPTAH
jgi:hypothetical protein